MSTKLNGIAGNEEISSRLAREILNRTLPHAYIIEGKTGSGRRTVALTAAAALACTHKSEDLIPCRTCPACRRVLSGNTPDVVRIKLDEDKQSIGVDISRFIRQDIISVPNDFDFKLYIIEDADLLTPQAQNALLLTLESPPEYAYFFLICESASLMLDTVRSRAPVLRTKPVPSQLLHDFLVINDPRASDLEKCAPGELDEIILASDGSIGHALDLLEPKKRQALIEGRRIVCEFVRLLLEDAHARDKLKFISLLSQKREELSQLLSDSLIALRDIIVLKKSDGAPLCFWTNREEASALADAYALGALMRLSVRIYDAQIMIERNANLKLTLFNLLLT